MSKFLSVIETAEWVVKPNPLLKSELMIVRKHTDEIIASLNLANFDSEDEATACAELIAIAPRMRRAFIKVNATYERLFN
jgi:hypothetical protein